MYIYIYNIYIYIIYIYIYTLIYIYLYTLYIKYTNKMRTACCVRFGDSRTTTA